MSLVPIDVFRVARLAIGTVARPFKISFLGHIVAANPSVVTGIVVAIHDFFNDKVLLVLRSHIPFPHHIKMNSTTKDNKNNLTTATRTGWGGEEEEAKSSSNNPTTPKISIRREGCSVVDSETSDSETTTEPNTMTHTMTRTTTLTITHNYETSDSETAARRDEKESA